MTREEILNLVIIVVLVVHVSVSFFVGIVLNVKQEAETPASVDTVTVQVRDTIHYADTVWVYDTVWAD